MSGVNHILNFFNFYNYCHHHCDCHYHDHLTDAQQFAQLLMLHVGDLLSEPQTMQPIEQGGVFVLEVPNGYWPSRGTCLFSSISVRIVLILLCNSWHHLIPSQQLPITLHDLTSKCPNKDGKILVCGLGSPGSNSDPTNCPCRFHQQYKIPVPNRGI